MGVLPEGCLFRSIGLIEKVSGLQSVALEKLAVDLGAFYAELRALRGKQPNGLLLGRVQSGKTTAMLLLAAAARDYGEHVVVILLGTTSILLNQNRVRLNDAFGIGSGQTDWAVIEASRLATAYVGSQKAIASGRTVLIPILKHHEWIERAAVLVKRLGAGSRLTVIDDESDVASLGNGVTDEKSPPTNRALQALLGSRGEGVYVHVTATPYGPLRLDPSDRLAPCIFHLLEPGAGYVGGQQFFIDKTAANMRVVGSDEVLEVSRGRTSPALAAALGIFTAISIKAKIENVGMEATSMLVHPSSSIVVHRKVERAIRQLQTEWMASLAKGIIPRDLEGGCTTAGLATVGAARLRSQISLMKIHIVNAGGANQINWGSSAAHILIGGNKLSRGFTFEGLTVTFVARKPSEQADTMLQRARFYGYRLGLGGLMHLFASKRTFDTWSDAAWQEKQLWDRLYDIKGINGDVSHLRRVVNLGSTVASTSKGGGGRAQALPSPWYPSRVPAPQAWRMHSDLLREAIESRNFTMIEQALVNWPAGGKEQTEGVRAPAFGYAMVHAFMARLRKQASPGVIQDECVLVCADSGGALIGVLANKEVKAFLRSTPCGIYLLNVQVAGNAGFLPILHQQGAAITHN